MMIPHSLVMDKLTHQPHVEEATLNSVAPHGVRAKDGTSPQSSLTRINPRERRQISTTQFKPTKRLSGAWMDVQSPSSLHQRSAKNIKYSPKERILQTQRHPQRCIPAVVVYVCLCEDW